MKLSWVVVISDDLSADHSQKLTDARDLKWITLKSALRTLCCTSGHEDNNLVILAAAFLGKTRLIDNIQVELKRLT